MVDGAGTSTPQEFRLQRLEDVVDRLSGVAQDTHQLLVRLEERDQRHSAEVAEVKAHQTRLASKKPTMLAVGGVMVPLLGAFLYVVSLIVAPIDQRSKVTESSVATMQSKQWTRDDHLRAYQLLRLDIANDMKQMSEWNKRQDDRMIELIKEVYSTHGRIEGLAP